MRYDILMEHSPKFDKLCADARANVTEIPAEEVAERMAKGESFALVDVREESEVAKGRIKSARYMGRGVLERDIEKAIPDLDAEIVLYCGGGYRSVLSAESLQKMGYRNVKSMAGGWRRWKEKGLPTEG
jgi:rhodanese-related sulfurtransferase